MKKQVSILGCGWLGLPLARHLLKNGWKVKGSTTSSDKIQVLEAEGINSFIIELLEDKVAGYIRSFLENSELLIIDIPPGLRRDPNSDFIAKLKKLTEAISESKINKILYVSSTGVFDDHESNPSFTEHYNFTQREVENSQLVQAEQLLLNLKKIQTSVIRFGGLIGNDRHPVKYLAGKTGIKNPKAPVNLIHLDNCILLISEIIQQNKFGEIFHGVEDIKLSKEDYYSKKAKELSLPIPEFDHETTSEGKEISMAWTTRILGVKLEKRL
ncbi:NAD(P)H-binding protein [Psychroflexus sp. CAK8W]|uniref:NAD(P)H-binding protein n=1 Tax=Psychroflexus longus TaxID=2873596 RepID=A0ABS7XGR9_9FLAO|nr:NAD(P)H-binding protein [Psychroflexus longus]MBZ9777619.1 NAD(P)H-binding protein [Psychroflexus longus]